MAHIREEIVYANALSRDIKGRNIYMSETRSHVKAFQSHERKQTLSFQLTTLRSFGISFL